MLRESARQEGSLSKKIVPTCKHCNIKMKESILTVHFPRGSLPGKGYKCEKCGYEVLSAEESEELQKMAEDLGLYEPTTPLRRKITMSGKQLAIYIPKDIKDLLNLKKGMEVRVYLQGDKIVVEPV